MARKSTLGFAGSTTAVVSKTKNKAKTRTMATFLGTRATKKPSGPLIHATQRTNHVAWQPAVLSPGQRRAENSILAVASSDARQFFSSPGRKSC
jgi:hypothetical protein